MSNKNDGGPAFPLQYDPYVEHPAHGRVHRATVGEDIQEGMALRDYFAGQALPGILANDALLAHKAPYLNLPSCWAK